MLALSFSPFGEDKLARKIPERQMKPKTAPFVVVFVATHVLRVKTLEVIEPLKGRNPAF